MTPFAPSQAFTVLPGKSSVKYVPTALTAQAFCDISCAVTMQFREGCSKLPQVLVEAF
jgi:hypothetical protein